MPCHRIGNAIFCTASVYEYNGYSFEFHHHLGPMPIRKDGEPMKRIPKGFWDAIEEFLDLPDEEKEKYRVLR
jgi:hypothetical protein